jgi:hypothetical protein
MTYNIFEFIFSFGSSKIVYNYVNQARIGFQSNDLRSPSTTPTPPSHETNVVVSEIWFQIYQCSLVTFLGKDKNQIPILSKLLMDVVCLWGHPLC